jgi:hypothetical protein
MDSFVLAVIGGAVGVILIFGLLILVDKGKPSPPPASAPAKVAGKR